MCSSPEGADSEVRSTIIGIINGLGPPFAIHPWPLSSKDTHHAETAISVYRLLLIYHLATI